MIRAANFFSRISGPKENLGNFCIGDKETIATQKEVETIIASVASCFYNLTKEYWPLAYLIKNKENTIQQNFFKKQNK